MFYPIGFGGHHFFLYLIVPAILGIWAQIRVTGAFNRWGKVRATSNITGAECAREILQAAQIHDVDVVETNDFLGDHATFTGMDLGTGQPMSLTFGGGLNIVECCLDSDCDDKNECSRDTCVNHQCRHAPAPSGTPCTDRDGDQCTTAACDGNGMCDQRHAVKQQCGVTNCDIMYPFASTNPRTNVIFNESEVLQAMRPQGGVTATPGLRIKLWYNDERALVLGVRQVNVKRSTGTATANYRVSALPANPGSVFNPLVGTTALDGDQAGTDLSTCPGFPDLCDRPMFPALFITDITRDPNSKAGDWQSGGTPIPPHAVFGTWKGAVRTVDRTRTPPTITVQPDPDPAKNHWNLGAGDPPPPGLIDQGFGAEVVWNVDDLVASRQMILGRSYRLQFMVHDGDQNKAGGDTGENCVNLFLPLP